MKRFSCLLRKKFFQSSAKKFSSSITEFMVQGNPSSLILQAYIRIFSFNFGFLKNQSEFQYHNKNNNKFRSNQNDQKCKILEFQSRMIL